MKKDFNVKAEITHIALHVADVNRSADFYRDWCGMDVVHQHESEIEGQPVTWIASPGHKGDFVIVLVPGGKGANAKEGLRHIGLAMEEIEDVEALAERAKDAGILHWPLQTMPWPVGTLFSIKDPDGHVIEFSYGQPLGRDFKAAIRKFDM